MKLHRGIRAVLAFALLGGPVLADGPKPGAPLSAPEAATAALEAFRAHDGERLRALAALDDPDPWLVVDELLARGESDAADSFSRASPRPDVERLPDYVATRRGQPDDPAARTALAAGNAALLRQDWAAALAAAESVPVPTEGLLRIRLAMVRGYATRRLGRLEESVTALREAADRAERVGWFARMGTALFEAGSSARSRSDYGATLSLWEQRLAVEERRGHPLPLAWAIGNVGTAHSDLGDSTKALEHHERARVLFERHGDHAAAAVMLLNIGWSLHRQRLYAEAVGVYERALPVLREAGDRPNECLVLRNLGDACFAVDYRKSLGYWQQALELGEALDDPAAVGAALGGVARAHVLLGQAREAIRYGERALAHFDATGSTELAVFALLTLGQARENLGQPAAALALHGQALRRAEESHHEALVASALHGSASAKHAMGEYTAAIRDLEVAVPISERLGDRLTLAIALGSLGSNHQALGDHRTAMDFYARSLRVSEEIRDRMGVALMLGNMGGLNLILGQYAQGISQEERALALFQEVGDRVGVARTLGHLGSGYRSLGDHEAALSYQERSLAMNEELGHARGIYDALLNIGNVHFDAGDARGAVPYYERCLELATRTGRAMDVVRALSNLGWADFEGGEAERALGHLDRALQVARESGDRAAAVHAMRNISSVRWLRGEYVEALRVAEDLVSREEEMGLAEDLCQTLGIMSSAQWHLGRPREALATAHRAIEWMEGSVRGLAEGQSAVARERRASLYETAASAALEIEDVAEATFFIESGRAASLLESMRLRSTVGSAALPEDLVAAERESRAREASAAEGLRRALGSGGRTAMREARASADAARAERKAVVERIQRESRRLAGVAYPKADSAETIQERLQVGEVLVVYAVLPTAAVAVVFEPGSARIVPLGAPDTVRGAAAAFDPDAPEDEAGSRIEALRRAIAVPLALRADVRRVLVCPDAELCYVPFAPVFPDREVVWVPSATAYGLLVEERSLHGEGVLALGDPRYEAGPKASAFEIARGGRKLVPLPATREEAKAVGDVVLLGAEASEAGLARALAGHGRWRAVHLACHGLIDPERPTLSSLALSADPENDGFLTALDVFQMEVPADLVVLSACETAKGKVYRTEGVVGLTRAFMYAGAPRVIVSLWEVDDEATKELMVEFYRLWNPKEGKGPPAATALKRAQEHVRSQPKWSHPRYWAAWALWGLPE